jgi:hypothetical protein
MDLTGGHKYKYEEVLQYTYANSFGSLYDIGFIKLMAMQKMCTNAGRLCTETGVPKLATCAQSGIQ